MSPIDYTHILTKAVDELSDSQSYRGLFHQHREGEPLPSGKSLERIVELSRAILFPGYFGNSTINSQTINYHIGVNIEELFSLLIEQIQAGLCFGVENSGQCDCQSPCRATATQLAAEFISRLPEIRRILATDVEAAYYGDPAATCFGEIICCYPVIRAVTNYRIATSFTGSTCLLFRVSSRKWLTPKPESTSIRVRKSDIILPLTTVRVS